jgi:hypothetical protein
VRFVVKDLQLAIMSVMPITKTGGVGFLICSVYAWLSRVAMPSMLGSAPVVFVQELLLNLPDQYS